MWDARISSNGVETARAGVISPNRGASTRAEFTSVAPEGVSFAFTALGPLPRIEGSIAPAVEELGLPRMDEAAAFLGTLNLDAICMNGSIVGMFGDPRSDRELIGRLEAAAGVPATTMTTAMLDALEELDARRVVVVTSYDPTTLGIATDCLTALEYDLDVTTLDRRAGADTPSTDRIYRLVRRAVGEADDPDCVLILGGTVPSLELIADLEYDLDLPVTSDAQAALWALFRLLGVDPPTGYGELFRRG